MQEKKLGIKACKYDFSVSILQKKEKKEEDGKS